MSRIVYRGQAYTVQRLFAIPAEGPGRRKPATDTSPPSSMSMPEAPALAPTSMLVVLRGPVGVELGR
jgi:hypothetical protein